MSSRKLPSLNSTLRPRSAQKRPINLNVTTTAIGNCNRTLLNSTRTSATVTTDWELECDLAYSNYLQSIAIKQLFAEKYERNADSLDGQLCLQLNRLIEKIAKKTKLQNDFNQAQMMHNQQAYRVDYKKNVEPFLAALLHHQIEANLQQMIAYLEGVYVNLKLAKYRPFTTPEECQELMHKMQMALENLEKLLHIIGDTTTLRSFADKLKQCLDLHEEIAVKYQRLHELEESVCCTLLKKVSDKFASGECHQVSF